MKLILIFVCVGFCLVSALTTTLIGSTVPANGDKNPYGVAIAPEDIGDLDKGDVLVSNFNDARNRQGKGTTIVRFPRGRVGNPVLFAQINLDDRQCKGGVGLTAALVILKGGLVIVGSLPTDDGKSSTAGDGCLIVLNSTGKVVTTIQHRLLKGPWDMTALQREPDRDCDERCVLLFVSTVLNGDVRNSTPHVVNKGAVIRIALELNKRNRTEIKVKSIKRIGSGFSEKADREALFIGPTGLALKGNNLFVADSLNNRIAVLPNAVNTKRDLRTGNDVSGAFKLNVPLGLDFSKSLNILAANGGDSNVVQISPSGDQLQVFDTRIGEDGLFGIAIKDDDEFYCVDGNTNALKHFQI